MRIRALLFAPLFFAMTLAARADLLGDTVTVEEGIRPFVQPEIGYGPALSVPGGGTTQTGLFGYFVSRDQISILALHDGGVSDEGLEFEFDDITRNPMLTNVSVEGTYLDLPLSRTYILDGSTLFVDFFWGSEQYPHVNQGDSITLDLSFANTSPVPEPTSLILLGTGLVGGVMQLHRRKAR